MLWTVIKKALIFRGDKSSGTYGVTISEVAADAGTASKSPEERDNSLATYRDAVYPDVVKSDNINKPEDDNRFKNENENLSNKMAALDNENIEPADNENDVLDDVAGESTESCEDAVAVGNANENKELSSERDKTLVSYSNNGEETNAKTVQFSGEENTGKVEDHVGTPNDDSSRDRELDDRNELDDRSSHSSTDGADSQLSSAQVSESDSEISFTLEEQNPENRTNEVETTKNEEQGIESAKNEDQSIKTAKNEEQSIETAKNEQSLETTKNGEQNLGQLDFVFNKEEESLDEDGNVVNNVTFYEDASNTGIAYLVFY